MSHEVAKRPLFRQEVVAFQQQGRQWGRVVPLEPLPTRLMVWFVIASAVSIIALLFVVQYARKETVVGFLAPAAGTARIHVPQHGTITAVHVVQGQQVQAGQPLLAVATTRIAADGQDVDATILASLTRQKDALQRQIAGEEVRAQSERERLMAQMQGLEVEIGHLDLQIATQAERVRVVERMVAAATQLAPRGLVSEIEQRRREDALLEQRLNLNMLQQQTASRRTQLGEARFTLEQLPTEIAQRIQLMRNELAATEQRIAEVEGRRAFVLHAPIAGRIATLQAHVGQVADPQRLKVQIVPRESALQAELFIPTRAIGFVEPGQDVRILYEAFPYQHFGTFRGRIVMVSQTMLSGADLPGQVPLREPAYRAIAELERHEIDARGRTVPLQSDMVLRADIILERRTLMQWVLGPLLGARIQG